MKYRESIWSKILPKELYISSTSTVKEFYETASSVGLVIKAHKHLTNADVFEEKNNLIQPNMLNVIKEHLRIYNEIYIRNLLKQENKRILKKSFSQTIQKYPKSNYEGRQNLPEKNDPTGKYEKKIIEKRNAKYISNDDFCKPPSIVYDELLNFVHTMKDKKS